MCNVMQPSRRRGPASFTSHIAHRTSNIGFTLVEVLAALVFLGIVVPVTMRCATVCLQTTAHARHTLEASQLAELKLAQILIDRDTDNLDAAGDFTPDFPEYTWQIESAAFDSPVTGVSDLRLVTVHIRWLERTSQRSCDLSTLMYPDTSASSSTTTTAGANQ
ncbi:MAG: type IV pilus modification PilV family protein [Phycisphaerales bacterium]